MNDSESQGREPGIEGNAHQRPLPGCAVRMRTGFYVFLVTAAAMGLMVYLLIRLFS